MVLFWDTLKLWVCSKLVSLVAIYRTCIYGIDTFFFLQQTSKYVYFSLHDNIFFFNSIISSYEHKEKILYLKNNYVLSITQVT